MVLHILIISLVNSVRFKLLTIKYVLRMKREITLYCKRGRKEKSFSQIFVIDFNYSYFFKLSNGLYYTLNRT